MRLLRRRFALAVIAVLFLVLAWAAWWFTPLEARFTLPGGADILRLSPDGKYVLTRHGGQAKFWEVASGRAIGTLPDDVSGWPPWTFVFSPDAHWLAASNEGVLKVWQVPAGRESAAISISADKKLRVRATFSPDGKLLACRAAGPEGAPELRIWDVEQGRERAVLAGRPLGMRFSPDGKTLAFESMEGKPNSKVQGEKASSAGFLGRIRLWDAVTGKEKPGLDDKPGPPRRLVFSPDSRVLVTGQRKRGQGQGPYEVKLWDLESGKSRGPWTLPWGVVGLSFSADGSSILATSFGEAWEFAVIDLASKPGEARPAQVPRSLSLSLSADNRLLALSSNSPGTKVSIFELPEFRERVQLESRSAGDGLFLQGFSPHGTFLAAVAGWTEAPPFRRFRFFRGKGTAAEPADDRTDSGLLDGELHHYEATTGRWQGTVPVVRSARPWFTPDGKTLAVLAPDGTPTIWDLPLRTPWGKIVPWWGLLAVGSAVVGVCLRKRCVT